MITLSSDFRDYYPAAMRGVVLQHTDARVVDVSHDLPRQNVRAGAFWLRELLPYFPPAVHLAVLDPGVGTDRDAVVVRAGDHTLVGPDNGVLLPVIRRLTGEDGPADALLDGTVEAFRVLVADGDGEFAGPLSAETESWWPPTAASNTFHGRDVFAPAAARVHEREALADDPGLERVGSLVDCQFPTATVAGDHATGTVLAVDDFGNVITNIPGSVLAENDRYGTSVEVSERSVPVVRTYGTVELGERLVTVGSHGRVELAINQGRGDEAFLLQEGDSVDLSW